MEKKLLKIVAIFMAMAFLFSGCIGSPKINNDNSINNGSTTPDVKPGANTENQSTPVPDPTVTPIPIPTVTPIPRVDIEKIKPNENGKIMVVMFHNFVDSYKKGDKLYTTTFDDFRRLLDTLYDKGYRLISLKDFLDNNINVPAGCIPIVFTFDDGTSGQFNLIEKDEKLLVNPQSAVGIMEEFYKAHPDFGLEGTFYVNLGLGTFQGEGMLADRVKYLADKGFEIGNHTMGHVHLNALKSADEVQKEVGGNQKKIDQLIQGYTMFSLSLPYGERSKNYEDFVIKGEYEGVKYENAALMEVGWDPSVSPVSKKFNPFAIHRVRASGIEPVEADLGWWLQKLSRNEQYISDGNSDTVVVPQSRANDVDESKLQGKNLTIY